MGADSLVNWSQWPRPYQSVSEAVAAAEKAVVASGDIVGYAPLTLLVLHYVSVLLLEQETSCVSAARWLRCSTVLLDLSTTTVKRLPHSFRPQVTGRIMTALLLCKSARPQPDLEEVPVSLSEHSFPLYQHSAPQ